MTSEDVVVSKVKPQPAPVLTLRPAEECRFDAVGMGEVMLRLDPGPKRVRATRAFDVWEGGGEYNVVRGLSRVFGLRTSMVTALAENEVGRLIEGLILAGGVDVSLIRWMPYDGIGERVRNGLNFTERGFGVRGALGVSDRGHSAASQLSADEVDFDELFGKQGVRWLHTGGIFAGLSETTTQTTIKAIQTAHKYGTIVSYDVNYRPSIWKSNGGQQRAIEVNREIAPMVDVMIGSEEDFSSGLGFEISGMDEGLTDKTVASFESMINRVAAAYPNLKVIATTISTVASATTNNWGALAWSPETGLLRSTFRPGLEVFDRVGGGDAFGAGFVFGLIDGQPLGVAVDYGAANGALEMTTPGDSSYASKPEVLALASGGTARLVR
ncbi:2-dehydro-3-deoxygluconokinase [Propionibacterium cyclohexanicum]|uniref:2-dehydro-3-deoxygluconokinase n=1 Tax=Propionibacterium cyclohexanicum TaxID=64702 RepID=A0A1H9SQQ9_9ACTN|nr:sugar kinase [Propionibacterium cyclohexanicum]SER86669.1 2-dehydro-3-deoxygluconokinase [Propionibacterium cyclohexanicum]